MRKDPEDESRRASDHSAGGSSSPGTRESAADQRTVEACARGGGHAGRSARSLVPTASAPSTPRKLSENLQALALLNLLPDRVCTCSFLLLKHTNLKKWSYGTFLLSYPLNGGGASSIQRGQKGHKLLSRVYQPIQHNVPDFCWGHCTNSSPRP